MSTSDNQINSNIRFLRILNCLMAAGATMVAASCAFVVLTVPVRELAAENVVMIQQWARSFLFILVPGAFIASIIIPGVVGGKRGWYDKFVHAPRPTDPIARIRMSMLVKLVILEMCSVFGLAIWMYAGLHGLLKSQPFLWFLTAPYLYLITNIIKTFPSRATFQESGTSVGV